MRSRTLTVLTILSLAAVLSLSACWGGAANNANTAVNRPTPLPTTTTSAVSNTGDKAKVEEALKKAGFTDVTFDTSTTPATLRGSVPKGKTQDMVKAATEAAGKPVKNETIEK